MEALLAAADLIRYDVQRIAHELWDYAKLKDKRELDASDVNSVIEALLHEPFRTMARRRNHARAFASDVIEPKPSVRRRGR